MIDPDDLVLSGGLTLAGIIAVVVLLLSAIAAMAALRTAVRAMFASEGRAATRCSARRASSAGFVGMAIAVLLSAILTTSVASAASWVLDALGWGSVRHGRAAGARASLVAFVIDAATFLLVVKVLAGENPAVAGPAGGAP